MIDKKDRPRICYILGGEDTPLEVGERFRFEYPYRDYGDLIITSDGGVSELQENGRACRIRSNALLHMIEHPESIIRRPHYTDQDLAIMRGRVAEGTPWAARDEGCWGLSFHRTRPIMDDDMGWGWSDGCCKGSCGILTWLKPGECVDLREILLEVDGQ